MNLGFWIAWFRYQKLNIFLFEYLTWRQRILPREGFSPSSREWFEWFVLDQGLNRKVLNEGLNWRRILRAAEGGWIIINDRIFTTPNKKNKTLQLHPPSDFFPFFSAVFLSHHAWFLELKTTFLLPHFKRSSWPYGRKEKNHIIL